MTTTRCLRIFVVALVIPVFVAAGGSGPTLIDAAKSGDKVALRALLAKTSSAVVNTPDGDGSTALHWAAYRDDLDASELLIRAGANVNAANDLGVTPLWTACQNGSEAMVAKLLAAGANPNAALLAGETPVMVAARAGHPAVVEQLIAKGANLNAHGSRGQTALMWAVSQKHPDAVKALLDHGADANAPLKTWTPTRRSSHDWNFVPEFVGATPFWMAARFDEPNVMHLLLKHGANPLFVHHGDRVVESRNSKDGYETKTDITTPLMAAVGFGGGTAWVDVPRAQREAQTLETVKLAVELGIDVNATSADGRTALDGAQALKYLSVIKFLEEKGAKTSGKKGPAPREEI